MSLKGQIDKDIIVAMRASLPSIVTTLRYLKAEVQSVEKNTGSDLDDSAVARIIQKQIKRLDDSIKFAEQGNREDLVSQYKAEKSTISKYLPKQLTEEELKKEIDNIIRSNNMDNIGSVMKKLRSEFDGRFDGKTASEIIKGLL